MSVSTFIPALQLSVRAALAAGLATAIAQILGLPFPLYAMIAAVIVTELLPSQTRILGMRRLVGTVLGAMFGATLSPLLQNAPWAIALSIMVSMLIAHLLRLQDAAKMTGYVCAIVLLNHSDNPWSYALYRLIETTLGIGVAVLVSYLPKLIPSSSDKERKP
jgi:uncharacterized membrane protein YgaE (UPF0421/DUF939 family)